MDFSLPSLRQIVTSLAWPSSWRWVTNLEEEASNEMASLEEASSEDYDEDSEKKVHEEDAEKKVEEKSEDVVAKSEVEEVQQQETEILKTKSRSQIEQELSIIEKPASQESEEGRNVVPMLNVSLESTLFEEVKDVTLENTLFAEVEDVTLENILFEEVENVTLENTLFEEVKEDSLLDITAQIMENVLEDVWRSNRSCIEDISSEKLMDVPSSPEEEPLPKSNDTIADIWMEMNRKAEEEMDRERDELIEELIVDLDEDDFEVVIVRDDLEDNYILICIQPNI